jgi:ubiquitin carboxyl-terminal hydrolase 5/13
MYIFTQRNSRHQSNPSECFKFKVEDRFECLQSHKVKYTYRTEYCLPLPIPLNTATNKEELDKYEQTKAEAEKSGQKL